MDEGLNDGWWAYRSPPMCTRSLTHSKKRRVVCESVLSVAVTLVARESILRHVKSSHTLALFNCEVDKAAGSQLNLPGPSSFLRKVGLRFVCFGLTVRD